jgi:hypothetical protein
MFKKKDKKPKEEEKDRKDAYKIDAGDPVKKPTFKEYFFCLTLKKNWEIDFKIT